MKRFNVLAKTDDLVLIVAKDRVDGEFHKEHVDGLAMPDDQGFTLRKFSTAKQAFHASPRIIGNFNGGGDGSIACAVTDHVFQK